MQLGKKTNTRLYVALSSEIATVDESPVSSSAASSAPETHFSSASEGIQVSLTETTTAKTHRDGGLETMEVQGLLNLHISDSTISRIQLDMRTSEADGTQFKTHPNIDRKMFKDQHKIGFRNSAKGFPLNQQMCVLRWRLQAKVDSTTLPISGWFPFQCSSQSILGHLQSVMVLWISASNMKLTLGLENSRTSPLESLSQCNCSIINLI